MQPTLNVAENDENEKKKKSPSFMVVGIPPTKIFLVLKSLEPIAPLGIVRLISTYTSPKTTQNTNKPSQQLKQQLDSN